jgi:subfamily B ATP-binding cassette protein MsbA
VPGPTKAAGPPPAAADEAGGVPAETGPEKERRAEEERKLAGFKSARGRLLALLKPHRLKLFLAVVSMSLAGASTAGMAYLIEPLLNHVFFKGDSSLLWPLSLLTFGVFAATGVFTFLQSYLMNKVGYTIVNDLRVRLFAHIQRQSLGYHDRHPSGELVSRVVNDVALIQSSVTQVVTGLVMDVCKVLGLVAVLFARDWRLALMGLAAMPLAVAPIVRFGRSLRKLATNSQLIMGSLVVTLSETIQGVRVVQSYNMTDFEIKRFARECRRNVDNLMRSVTVRGLSSAVMEIFGGLCLSAVIFYGGRSVIMGGSNPGTFFSFMTAILLLYEPLKRLTRIHNEIQQGVSAAVRIFDTLDAVPSIVAPPGGLRPAATSGRVEFRDVRFSYDGAGAPDGGGADGGGAGSGREALAGVTLSVSPGEVLALVGQSGGGKTSLVNLVPRFYDPTSGGVYLDGRDVRTLDLAFLRGQVALVSQDVTLFEASVRHNIAYGNLSASLEQVEAAARAALADEFVRALPGGYDENVGERGGRLSGGQRQRLAVARAILKDAPVLILDEATSALDTESEKHVQAALENLMRGRTTLVIAHRLSTVVRADRIAVLKAGRVVEEGRHDDLMALRGEYHRLYSLQFADAADGAGALEDPGPGTEDPGPVRNSEGKA